MEQRPLEELFPEDTGAQQELDQPTEFTPLVRTYLHQLLSTHEPNLVDALTKPDIPNIVEVVDTALNVGDTGLTTDEKAHLTYWLAGLDMPSIVRVLKTPLTATALKNERQAIVNRLDLDGAHVADPDSARIRKTRRSIIRDYLLQFDKQYAARKFLFGAEMANNPTIDGVLDDLASSSAYVTPERRDALRKHLMDRQESPTPQERRMIKELLTFFSNRAGSHIRLEKIGRDRRTAPYQRKQELLRKLIGSEKDGLPPLSRAELIAKESRFAHPAMKTDATPDNDDVLIAELIQWIIDEPLSPGSQLSE